MNNLHPATPAMQLEGKRVGIWNVLKRSEPQPTATGGQNSVQYRVTSDDGNRAFLKAADLFAEPSDNDVNDLELLLRLHRYEAELLTLCAEKSMDRVVRSLDAGVHIERVGGLPIRVPYIVFEEAENDVRSHQNAQSYDLSWRLRIFHGVCVAMQQLHAARIAHQDLKPSNVLVFDGAHSKVADLGRATMEGNPSLFECLEHVGDRNYWPLELLYRDQRSWNWLQRRLGADFFMMGCVLTFLLTNSSLLTLMFERLDKRFWPHRWGGTYQDVVPHLTNALNLALSEIKPGLPRAMADELVGYILMFSNPSPDKRGNLRSSVLSPTQDDSALGRIGQQYSLEYIISRMDDLAFRAKSTSSAFGAELNRVPFLQFLNSNKL